MESLIFRSSLEFGDVFVLKRQRKDDFLDFSLQMIEATRVKTPTEGSTNPYVKAGIEIDPETGEARSIFVESQVNNLTYEAKSQI